jgi:hypothetical protein
MNENMFVWYLKEHVLELRQTPTCVYDLVKQPSTKGKTKPLSFQKVGLESRLPRVIGFKYLVMSSRTKKCQYQHVLLHPKEYGDHLARHECQV